MTGNVFSMSNKLINLTVSAQNSVFELRDGILYNKEKNSIVRYPGGRMENEFVIPDGIVCVEDSCFADTNDLLRITLPDSVKTIEDYAFFGCKQCKYFDLGEGVVSIGDCAIPTNQLRGICLPDSIASMQDLSLFSMVDEPYAYDDFWVLANDGSYAKKWAKRQGYDVQSPTESALESIGAIEEKRVELKSVTYSEHPHYELTEVYSDGSTIVVENEAGYVLSRELCDECYPVEFNADTLMEMALWAMDAYETRGVDPSEYPAYLKDAVRFNDIDCLVIPELTDDGKMCLTLSFEGSKWTWEWGNDWYQDLLTESDDHGMHTGIAQDFGNFISAHAEELFALLNLVRESGGSIQITGHSYGGGMTQLMAYWLLTEYDFPKEGLVAYTFASPVVLSYEVLRDEALRGAYVYNIINTSDIVPDLGITAGYEKWKDYIVLADAAIEEVVNLLLNGEMGGGITLSGCNLGTNFYLSGDELELSRLLEENQDKSIEAFHQLTIELSQRMQDEGTVLDYIATQHSMEMYMELVKAAIVGEQRGYMVNLQGETIVPDEGNVKYYGDNLSFYVGKPQE